MWTLENHERQALAAAQRALAREDIVDHGRAKLDLPAVVDKATLRQDLIRAHDQARGFLNRYPEASYRTYVLATLICTLLRDEVLKAPEPWVWLKNDRVGANTRVDLAYRIMKSTVNRGICVPWWFLPALAGGGGGTAAAGGGGRGPVAGGGRGPLEASEGLGMEAVELQHGGRGAAHVELHVLVMRPQLGQLRPRRGPGCGRS